MKRTSNTSLPSLMGKKWRKILTFSALAAALLPLGNACSKMELTPEFREALASVGDVSEFFSLQWTLVNTGQTGGVPGEDANVLPVWTSGNTGQNVLIAIVDDGMELAHPDLKENVSPGSSYNFNNGTTDPSGPDALHGTSVAGVIAGSDNGTGIMGVAPGAKLAGFNFLASNVDANEIEAMIHNAASIAASNNSWGPGPSGYGLFRSSSSAWRLAVEEGLLTGRGGKGTVYLMAAGNGAISPHGEAADHSNLNGYANFYGVTAVCAVDEFGKVAIYSEPGANLWVCAPSGSGLQDRPAVMTTDLTGGAFGYNLSTSRDDVMNRAYTKTFNGTSAAAPVVTGVVALILKERPDLSWRDVKWILARSARKNDASNEFWEQNGATPPMNIHYDYGFGVVDAAAAVKLAKAWTPVGPMKTVSSPSSGDFLSVEQALPDDGTVVTSLMNISGSGINKIEFVEITIDATHVNWGSLTIAIERSGTGITTSSLLTIDHKCLDNRKIEADCNVSGNTFRFGSTRHLGEPADGTWTLKVVDAHMNDGKTGTLNRWRMRFFGE